MATVNYVAAEKILNALGIYLAPDELSMSDLEQVLVTKLSDGTIRVQFLEEPDEDEEKPIQRRTMVFGIVSDKSVPMYYDPYGELTPHKPPELIIHPEDSMHLSSHKPFVSHAGDNMHYETWQWPKANSVTFTTQPVIQTKHYFNTIA